MSLLTICPCCSNSMLHYLNHSRDYWFCRNCWQEMPNWNNRAKPSNSHQNKILNLSIGMSKMITPNPLVKLQHNAARIPLLQK